MLQVGFCLVRQQQQIFVLEGNTCTKLNTADLEQRASNTHKSKVASTLEGERRSCLFM